MSLHKICFAILLGIACVSPSNAAIVLIGYDTTNPNGADGDPSPDLGPAEFFSSLTPLDLARGPGLIPNAGVAFNSNNWSEDPTLDLGSDRYISWGWSDSVQLLDLTSMTLQYDISPTGPSQLAIAISVNGDPFEVVFSDSSVDPSDETHTINLAAFSGVQSAEFRLFGFDAGGAAGTLDIEEIIEGGGRGILVMGDVSAVPEPASWAFLGLVGTVLVARRRRNFHRIRILQSSNGLDI